MTTNPFEQIERRVEGRRAISVFALRKAGAFTDPWEECDFRQDGVSLSLVRDELANDWYIRLDNPAKGCDMSAFNLEETDCNYGKGRWWLVCPRCEARAGILYERDANFACRKCHGLEYKSHTVNYRSIRPGLIAQRKYEEMDAMRVRHFYAGKVTKIGMRIERLRLRAKEGIGKYAGRYLNPKG